MRIRKMERKDMVTVALLSGQLGYPCTENEADCYYDELRKFPQHEIFVAEAAGGEVVGWIHVFLWPSLSRMPIGELGGLVVDEKIRGQGVGSQLLKAAENWVVEKGFAGLRFSSRATRAEAHRFYEGRGYKVLKSSIYFQKEF